MEFCESPCLPDGLRSRVFSALNDIQVASKVDKAVTDMFSKILKEKIQSATRVIEIGSGSGKLLARLAQNFADFDFVLTDLFPQESWRSLSSANLSYLDRPVDASQIKQSLGSELRPGDVLFMNSTFHHFRPEWVKGLLELLVERGCKAIIIEPMSRDIRGMIVGAGAGAFSLLTSREAWRDPRIPFILSFDGVISALRQYHREDLVALSNGRLSIEEFGGHGILNNVRAMLISPGGEIP